MDKKTLVAAVAAELEISKKEATEKINEYDVITRLAVEGTEAGEKTKIGNYVVVEKKEVAARTCRNPKTGETIEVAAHIATKIKHSSVVKSL